MNDPSASESAPSPYPSSFRAWWSVATLTVLFSLSLLDRQIMALLVPDIRSDLGLSDFQLGLLQGIGFALFYVVFGLGVGWIVDQWSRRGIVYVGVTIWSVATAACGLAGNFVQLLLARSGVGAGEAALNPAAYSLLSDTFPKRRLSFAISVFGTGAYIGGTISLLLGGFLIASLPRSGLSVPVLGHLEPWRVAFLVAGLPGLLIALLTWSLADPPRRERLAGSASLRDTMAFLRSNGRFFVGHFLGFALMAAMANGFQAWAPAHLTRQFGISVAEVVMILAPIGLVAGISGALLAGWVTDKLYARGVTDVHLRYFLVSTLLQAACMFVAMTATELWIFIVFITLFVAAAGYAGAGPAALQLVTPNNYRGQVSAAYLFVFNLVGTGVGPTMVGAITTFVFRDDGKVGWAVATTTLILAPLSAVALASALGPMRRAVAASRAWHKAD